MRNLAKVLSPTRPLGIAAGLFSLALNLSSQTNHTKEAYLDIGSGSTKLILLDYSRGGKSPDVEIIRVPILFQKHMTKDRRFPPEIEILGLTKLSEFADLARRAGAVLKEGGATAVFRQADPSYVRALFSSWEGKTGWKLRILTPEEEARAAYHAISLVYPEWKDAVGLDMGAGSLQLMAMERGQFVFHSLPWGANEVKKFLAAKTPRTDVRSAVKALREEITGSAVFRSQPLPKFQPQVVIGGVGYGLWKALSPKDHHLTEKALLKFALEVGPLTAAEIEARYPSTARYGDEMWSNAVAFLAWMQILDAKEWTFLELETGVGLGVLLPGETRH